VRSWDKAKATNGSTDRFARSEIKDVVVADLFLSPTAAAVIEVYLVAMSEYHPPKEMLTDNGRQYTTWRGKSRFEAELQKDRVIHIKSRPQHLSGLVRRKSPNSVPVVSSKPLINSDTGRSGIIC